MARLRRRAELVQSARAEPRLGGRSDLLEVDAQRRQRIRVEPVVREDLEPLAECVDGEPMGSECLGRRSFDTGNPEQQVLGPDVGIA